MIYHPWKLTKTLSSKQYLTLSVRSEENINPNAEVTGLKSWPVQSTLTFLNLHFGYQTEVPVYREIYFCPWLRKEK